MERYSVKQKGFDIKFVCPDGDRWFSSYILSEKSKYFKHMFEECSDSSDIIHTKYAADIVSLYFYLIDPCFVSRNESVAIRIIDKNIKDFIHISIEYESDNLDTFIHIFVDYLNGCRPDKDKWIITGINSVFGDFLFQHLFHIRDYDNSLTFLEMNGYKPSNECMDECIYTSFSLSESVLLIKCVRIFKMYDIAIMLTELYLSQPFVGIAISKDKIRCFKTMGEYISYHEAPKESEITRDNNTIEAFINAMK